MHKISYGTGYLKHPSAADRRTVKCIRYFNSVTAVACVYNLTIPDINCYMANRTTAAIENQIARLQFRCTHTSSISCLSSGRMWQVHAILRHNLHRKSGAIDSICQACPTPDIAAAYIA